MYFFMVDINCSIIFFPHVAISTFHVFSLDHYLKPFWLYELKISMSKTKYIESRKRKEQQKKKSLRHYIPYFGVKILNFRFFLFPNLVWQDILVCPFNLRISIPMPRMVLKSKHKKLSSKTNNMMFRFSLV